MANKYTATESMLGYLYQCRYALLKGLQQSRKQPGLSISIEKFDDVAFEKADNPIELIQTKHHCTPGNVSDFSVDIWKTLKVWMDHVINDPNGTADTRFVLLTTSTAAKDSALSALREYTDDRDEKLSIELLTAAAKTSTNNVTASARQQFLELSDNQLQLLVASIWVFDNAPNIIDVRDELEQTLYFAAPAKDLASLVSYLEGWWFGRIISALQGLAQDHIPLTSIESKVFEISETFKLKKLPLDQSIDAMLVDAAEPEKTRVFVRQLDLVNVSKQSTRAAVRDYYRAFAQRSRWVRENLFLDGEADRYDRSLIDDWEYEFAALGEDVVDADEQTKILKGRELLRWANRLVRPLRGRDELWLSRGSFQMLADVKRVGWHPEYDLLIGNIGQDME